MAKKPTNSGTPWTPQDVKGLKDLVKRNTPTRIIGLELGRSEAAVQAKASDLAVSLKPTNQPPYNRKPK